VNDNMTYVGLDVHDETIVAVWRRPGFRPKEMVYSNDEKGIERLVKDIGTKEIWAVYETSGVGFVLWDTLTRFGWKVDVLATTRLPQSVKSKKRKTDFEDAKRLLDLLMAHAVVGAELPNVWVPPKSIREDRQAVRHRLNLGDEAGRVRTKIKCLLKIHGLKYPGKAGSWTQKYMAWLRGLATPEAGLAESVWCVLASHLRQLEMYEDEIKTLDGQLERLSHVKTYEAQVAAVRAIKGFGLLTALAFLLELGDVARFKNRGQVGSYVGLTPTSHESGAQTDRKGHVTRMGPAGVRKVLNQAAWTYLRSNGCERSWYEQLKYRRGTKRAIVALMRRMAITAWRLASKVVKAGDAGPTNPAEQSGAAAARRAPGLGAPRASA